MRLNRLELIRYGRFKDAAIVFPAPASNAPDVTIIFGPNEAGKSTAYNAYLELLFGLKAGKHPYAFRFDRSDLLVGAELVLPDSGNTIVRRTSKKSQSLVDEENRPLNEALLSGALHGLSREAYQERFSLNETGLREGGERIAGAKGDLGQLLYAGISGLTGMAESLDSLEGRADTFHKKRGQGTFLKKGKDRLAEIKRTLRKEYVTPDLERSLAQDYDRATERFNTNDAVFNEVLKKQAAAEAARIWYEQTQIINGHEASLADFPDGPDLIPGAAESVAGLVEKILANAKQSKNTADSIAAQQEIIKNNPVDTQAQSLALELERLDQLVIESVPVMDRAINAKTDRKLLAEERDTLNEQINGILLQLQVAENTSATIALIAVNADELEKAARECNASAYELNAAVQQLNTARDRMGDAPSEPRNLNELRTVFLAWQEHKELTAVESEQSRCASQLNTAIAALPASWQTLVHAGLPTREMIDEINTQGLTLAASLDSTRITLSTYEADLAEAKAVLASLQSAPHSVDIDATIESLRHRDMQWQNHRAHLNNESADLFEQAMYADDSVRTHYLSGAEVRERLQTARTEVGKIEAKYHIETERFAALTEQKATLDNRSRALAQKLGLEEDAPPSSFSQRLQDVTTAATAAADLANAETELHSALERQQSARNALKKVASTLGIDVLDDDQFAPVQQVLFMEASDRKAWEQWQDDEKELAELDARLSQCKKLDEQAKNNFVQLTASMPLPDLSLDKIQVELPYLRRLQQLYSERDKLVARIETLDQVLAVLDDVSQRLARTVNLPQHESNNDPLVVITSARQRVAASMHAEQMRTRANDQLAVEKRQVSDLEAELSDAQSRLDKIFSEQSGAELEPKERVARLLQRDHIRTLRANAEDERKKARHGVDQSLFEDELGRLPDVLRKVQLDQEFIDAQALRDTARDEMNEARRIYRDTSESAERSDLTTEQATLLEELRHEARQAMVARLGVLAARGALRRLAKEKRSDMLKNVATAFTTMTAPAWNDVNVWSQGEGDKLVGIRNDGEEVPVDNMSTGTIGQLYFALRLAGYQSFARQPGPLPMVLDDVMETFDDTRAVAALKLCAEIGKNGQAILFTHHAHLVELARETLKQVSVVRIPD